MKITNKQKRKGKNAVSRFLTALKEFEIIKEDFLKVIHTEFQNEKNKSIFDEVFETAKNIKIFKFDFDSYQNLNDNNVFALRYKITFSGKSKLAYRYKVNLKNEKYAKTQIVEIRVIGENGNYTAVPIFLNELYKELIFENAVLETTKNATSNKLDEIPENFAIFGFNKNKLIGTLRKFSNKWIFRLIGVEKEYQKFNSRKDLILFYKDIEFKIAVDGEYKLIMI